MRRKPHIKVVNRAVRPDPLRHGGVMGPSIHHVTRLIFGVRCNLNQVEVGRLSSAPDDRLNRDAAYSSSSYTGRIQKSEVRRERVSSSVRAITGCCRTGRNSEAISLARYVATRTVRVLAKELICRRHRQGCDFVAISSIKKPTTSPSSLLTPNFRGGVSFARGQ